MVGPSGAGKSTLAKLLVRFSDPSSGSIRLDGHDIAAVTLASLRDNVSVLFQETMLFDGTISDNIAFGRPDATQAEIEGAAQRASAHEFVIAQRRGYDTPVGRKGRNLPGGERQRVALARTLLRDAPVMVLDEPSEGLDANSADGFLSAFKRLTLNRTSVIISHNLMTVRDADVIILLEEGRLVEQGTHDDLLARNGSYARLFRLQEESSPPELVGLARADGRVAQVR